MKRKSQEAHNEQQHFVEGGAPITVGVPAFGHCNPHCKHGEADAEAEPEPARGLTSTRHYVSPLVPERRRRTLVALMHGRGTATALSEEKPDDRANLSRNDESEREQDIALGVVGLGGFYRNGDIREANV